MLVKFRLNMTVVFSSVMAFLIVSEGHVNWLAVVVLALGGFLVTGAANTLNQVLEKDYDAMMKRTADRPIAAGRMSISEGVLAAGFMSMFGITLLALFNPWTAFLGMLALVSYAFLYTPMKRVSPIAVVIGAIPGALPVLIGSVAAAGSLTFLGIILFGIQFFWQFPHFWSIGWLGYEDYSKAGYQMVPAKGGAPDPNTGLQSFIYALFLVPVGIMPFYLGVSGLLSATVIVVLSIFYAYFGWNLYKATSREAARKLMFFSFAYIPVTLILLFLDKI